MHSTKLSALISSVSSKFSPKDRQIASYMLANQDEAASMSIAELASASGVSQSAAVRFCKKLGFEGTKDLRIFLNSDRSADCAAEPCTLHDSNEQIFSKALGISSASLSRSFDSTSAESLSSAARMIMQASNMLVFGIGGSAPVVSFMCNEFRRLGKMVFGYSDIYTIRTFRAHFASSDLLFLISRRGENEDLVKLAQHARKNGAMIAVLTSDPSSRLASIADRTVISSDMQYIEGDQNSFSRLGQIALVSCLYMMCASGYAAEDPSFDRNYLNLTNYR